MRKVSVILVLGCLLVASPASAQENWTWETRGFVFGGGGNTGFASEPLFHVGNSRGRLVPDVPRL